MTQPIGRRMLIAALTASFMLTMPSVRAQPSARLTPLRFALDFRNTGQTSPSFLAQSKGCYKDEGLDVSIDVGSGSVASIMRIANGVYQMGLGDISSLIEFHPQDPGPTAVTAVYQYYNRAPVVIIGRKDRSITTDLRSLKGKKIAAAAAESTRRSWPLVARKLQLKSDLFAWFTTDLTARDNVTVRSDIGGATYLHDAAIPLFARVKSGGLSIKSYASAGISTYGDTNLASSQAVVQNPKVVTASLRATNRAVVETFANPLVSIVATRAREPTFDEKVELDRWHVTAKCVSAPDTDGHGHGHGLGDIRKLVLEQQLDEVIDVYGLKTRPALDSLFNLSMLPTKAERVVKV